MDPERKTLADLSKEVKEKKYITLDTASKLSGYTIEYLERLCRLDKLEHRTILKGGFAIELQSLLRETHTLLISDNEIDFVDQRELAPPVVTISTPEAAPLVEPITLPVFRAPREPEPTLPPVAPAPPITPASIYSEYGDEWDALLLGSINVEEIVETPAPVATPLSLYHAPSVYRPVTTSADPLPHHDPAPLFPVLDKSGVQKEDVVTLPVPVVAPIFTPHAPVVSQTPVLAPPTPVVAPPKVFVAPVAAPVFVPPPVFTAPAPVPPPPEPVVPQQVVVPPATPTPAVATVPPLATLPVHALLEVEPLTPAPSISHLPEISPEHHLAIPESHALMEE